MICHVPRVDSGEDGIHSETGQAYPEVADRNVGLDLVGLGEENGKSDDDTSLRPDDEGHAPSIPVGQYGQEIGGESAARVRRDREKLRLGRLESHAADDGWQSELQSIVGDGVGPVGEDQEYHLPVGDHGQQCFPVEVLLAVVARARDSPGDLSKLRVTDLLWRKPARRSSRRIGQQNGGGETDDDGKEALHDEDLLW